MCIKFHANINHTACLGRYASSPAVIAPSDHTPTRTTYRRASASREEASDCLLMTPSGYTFLMKKTERLSRGGGGGGYRHYLQCEINHLIRVHIDVEIHRAGDRFAVTPANGSGCGFREISSRH